ncbi:hypothetical protein SKAU_G00015450 [Synaphobranchus kaupii]|uniref:Uncharacterized protein n=1 Tax=Synaphobranchus kaupii TaxID=118154 RepID=A0A9Q1GC10_SYNKA|nr:hypothetical protein SKAU_G00015440 [Synaphobranchus kaupii]KAJ8380767.1 hypothetical protein SKAU_G00015450 [Synaphobranchus kaupii]
MKCLVTDMKRDLQDLHRRFPGTKILLSAISQRRRWRTANPGKIDKTRKWAREEIFLSAISKHLDNYSQCYSTSLWWLASNSSEQPLKTSLGGLAHCNQAF